MGRWRVPRSVTDLIGKQSYRDTNRPVTRPHKAGSRVGFDRVNLSQTHARLINGQGHLPMTRPMGKEADPCPNPSGHSTLMGTHRVCIDNNFLINFEPHPRLACMQVRETGTWPTYL
jgi:hypothetical protein